MGNEPLVRDISDTARWVAYYRAQETARPDAIFRDPFAAALAGERGAQIAKAQPVSRKHAWSFMARTVLVDRYVTEAVRAGADTVLNLAAGLDTRPYRMDLPRTLKWVEADLSGILDYKEDVLGGAAPVCHLERVRVDLANENARRPFFERVGAASSNTLVLTEGLIIYFEAEQVASLARDLASVQAFTTWITDLSSPGLLKMIARQSGPMVAEGGAAFKFAPREGPDWFRTWGWTPSAYGSLLHTAAKYNRLPFFLKLMSLLPEPTHRPPERPWSAVLKLEHSRPGDSGAGQ